MPSTEYARPSGARHWCTPDLEALYGVFRGRPERQVERFRRAADAVARCRFTTDAPRTYHRIMSWQMGPMAAAIALGALVLGGVAVAVGALGCASETEASDVVASEARAPLRGQEPANADPSGSPVAGGQVIATLHTKESDLTITGTGDGMRYSLLEADGTRRDGLTLEQLEAYDRNLSDVVKFAMAKTHTPGAHPAVTPGLDARITPRPSRVELDATRFGGNRAPTGLPRGD